jgi:translocation and assembly module TamA
MTRYHRILLLFLLILMPSLAFAQGSGVRHTVTIAGLDDHAALKTLVEAVSGLVRLKDDLPPSVAGLRARAEQDRDIVLAALRSEAYFAASVVMVIGEANADGAVPVTVQIAPGPRYVIERIVPTAAEQSPADPTAILSGATLGLAPGAPARGPDIQALVDRLPGLLAGAGYPLAVSQPPKMEVDHRTRAVRIQMPIDTGPRATLGAVRVSGLQTLSPALISNRVPWQPGDVYKPARLDRFRQQLGKLDVFETTRTVTADKIADDGSLPIELTVTEKPPRFIGGGVRYSLSEGLDTQAYWGHRNLFGGAESLRLDASVGRIGARQGQGQDASLGLSFAKPDVFAPMQTLKTSITAEQEQPEAYKQRSLATTAGFERELSPIITVGYGTALEYSDTNDTSDSDRQSLTWGFPLTITHNTNNDPLDPTSGAKLTGEVTPYLATIDKTGGFVHSQVTAAWHYGFGEPHRPHVLAARAGYGMLFGANASDVPPDKRFYAGGAGTVRGYGAQEVGPLSSDGTPRGGRNLMTAGAEFRWRIGESWGVVPFVDAGAVTRSVAPDFAEDVQVGAGLGILYYTPIGPVRADFAVPVNPRPSDDNFQFYISLGQPF